MTKRNPYPIDVRKDRVHIVVVCSLIATATCLSIFWRNDDRIVEFRCDPSSEIFVTVEYAHPPIEGAERGFLTTIDLMPGAILDLEMRAGRPTDPLNPLYQLASPHTVHTRAAIAVNGRILDSNIPLRLDPEVQVAATNAGLELRQVLTRRSNLWLTASKIDRLQAPLDQINSDVPAIRKVQDRARSGRPILVTGAATVDTIEMQYPGVFTDKESIAQHTLKIGEFYAHTIYECPAVSQEVVAEVKRGVPVKLYTYIPVTFEEGAQKVVFDRRPDISDQLASPKFP